MRAAGTCSHFAKISLPRDLGAQSSAPVKGKHNFPNHWHRACNYCRALVTRAEFFCSARLSRQFDFTILP